MTLRGQGLSVEEAAKRVDLTSHAADWPQIRGTGADVRGVQRMYDLAANHLAQQLGAVAGVASVQVSGGFQRQIQVQVDYDKLDAYGLSLALPHRRVIAFDWVLTRADAPHAIGAWPLTALLLALLLQRRTAARPAAGEAIADARRLLADRECSGGGWNYGNRQVLGTNLEPYLQTTAAALIGLQEPSNALVIRGMKVIDRLWLKEPGGLGLSMALAAMRLNGQQRPRLAAALQRLVDQSELLLDGVSLAWTAIALGPTIARLRVKVRG